MESGSALDSTSNFMVYAGVVTEVESASDTSSTLVVFVATTAETGVALDLPSANAIYVSTVAESGRADEIVSGVEVSVESTIESGSAQDTVSVLAIFSAVAEEIEYATDLVSTTAVFAARTEETGSVLDTPTATAIIVTSVLENLSAIDSPTGQLLFPLSINEEGLAQDSSQVLHLLISDVLEQGDAVDLTLSTIIPASYLTGIRVNLPQGRGYLNLTASPTSGVTELTSVFSDANPNPSLEHFRSTERSPISSVETPTTIKVASSEEGNPNPNQVSVSTGVQTSVAPNPETLVVKTQETPELTKTTQVSATRIVAPTSPNSLNQVVQSSAQGNINPDLIKLTKPTRKVIAGNPVQPVIKIPAST